MVYHDFSGWDQSLFNYAKMLIGYKGIFEFDSSDLISFSNDYRKKQGELMNNLVEAHLFWIGFGVGVETLSKAVLLKHRVLSISRRSDFDDKKKKPPPRRTQFNTYQEAKAYNKSYTLNKYQKVYAHVNNLNIKCDNNPWLQSQFLSVGIVHPLEINTPTLHKIYSTEIPKLVTAGKISVTEQEELASSLEVLKLMRRNVDAHVFLQGRTIGSIDRDIEDIYVPLIKLLIEIYKRP